MKFNSPKRRFQNKIWSGTRTVIATSPRTQTPLKKCLYLSGNRQIAFLYSIENDYIPLFLLLGSQGGPHSWVRAFANDKPRFPTLLGANVEP